MPLSSFDPAEIQEILKAAEAEIATLKERLLRLQGPERDQAIIELAMAEARRAVA